jgi:hypothetical protein
MPGGINHHARRARERGRAAEIERRVAEIYLAKLAVRGGIAGGSGSSRASLPRERQC